MIGMRKVDRVREEARSCTAKTQRHGWNPAAKSAPKVSGAGDLFS